MPGTVAHTLFGSYLMPSLRHATVADAMHPGIVSCPAEATLSDVARLMATHRVHCIAVTGISHDNPGERWIWGLI
ncbi:MAG: CBS domain-containing protein [Solirubrobacteraceae bacterium]